MNTTDTSVSAGARSTMAPSAPLSSRCAWYPSAREIERIGKLGLYVDITPQQLVNDISSVERKLGPREHRSNPGNA